MASAKKQGISDTDAFATSLELENILAHYMLLAPIWSCRKIGCKVRSGFLRITLLVLSSRASFRAAFH